MADGLTGGCQCGAVRFRVERTGWACICHCRMCQKASGSFFAPFVNARGLEWTRGAPKYFQSSNRSRRGFCGDCGTPLIWASEQFPASIAIGAFDDPSRIPPVAQLGLEAKLPYCDGLADLPGRKPEDAEKMAAVYAEVVSRQHPDHDTEVWPPV